MTVMETATSVQGTIASVIKGLEKKISKPK